MNYLYVAVDKGVCQMANVFIYLILLPPHPSPSRTSYRSMGLFWAGSLLANMTVYVSGIIIGESLIPSCGYSMSVFSKPLLRCNPSPIQVFHVFHLKHAHLVQLIERLKYLDLAQGEVWAPPLYGNFSTQGKCLVGQQQVET